MNKLEKQLKKESKAMLPDEKFKDRVAKSVAPTISANKEVKPSKVSGKRVGIAFATSFAAMFVLALSIGLGIKFAPNNGAGGGVNGGGGGGNSTAVITQDVKSTYVYGAYTAGLLASGLFGGTGGATAAELTEEQIDFLGQSMALIESVMSSAPQIVDEASDNPSYTKKMTVTQVLLGGGTSTYVIYYNESASIDRYGEVTSRFWGVLTKDGINYNVDGKRERETEDGETEYEITMILTDATNASNKIVFEQEIEVGGSETEYEYAYSIYKGGVLSEKIEIELETEFGISEVELEILRNGNVNERYELTYSFTNALQKEFMITVKFPNLMGVQRISVVLGDTEYVFDDIHSYPRETIAAGQ